MAIWRAEVGDRMNQDGKTSVFIDCMHDGCEPPPHVRTGSSFVRKGQVHMLHDEGEAFKMPRGLRVECTYCRKNSPPSERLWLKGEAA